MAFYNQNNPYYPMNYYAPNYPGYATQGQPTQSNDFVPIPSEEDARNFPIQRGTSITFKDENLPFIYIKKLGMGQLDSPTFEVYEITKRTTSQNTQRAEKSPQRDETDKLSDYVSRAEYEEICARVDRLNDRVESLRKELGA